MLRVVFCNSTGTRNSENVDSTSFECGDSSNSGDGNLQTGDGRTVLGDGNKCLRHQKINVAIFYTFLKNTDIEYIEGVTHFNYLMVLKKSGTSVAA